MMTTRVSLILLGKTLIPGLGWIECVRSGVLKQPNKHIETKWGFLNKN